MQQRKSRMIIVKVLPYILKVFKKYFIRNGPLPAGLSLTKAHMYTYFSTRSQAFTCQN